MLHIGTVILTPPISLLIKPNCYAAIGAVPPPL